MAAERGAGMLGRMLGPYGVLRGNRNLQLLFGGQVVSSFGDWLYVLALGILAYEITGSATVVAVLMFARLLPYAVLLPFSGMLADRGNRKVLMISADLGRGCVHAGLVVRGVGEDALDRLPPSVLGDHVLEPVSTGDELGPAGYRGGRGEAGRR
jgi:hypothetical protein